MADRAGLAFGTRVAFHGLQVLVVMTVTAELKNVFGEQKVL